MVNTEPHDTQTAPPAAARETHEESVNPPPATAHPGTARRTPPESGRPALRPTAVKQEEGSDDDGVDTRGLRSCKGPPKQLSKQAVDRRLYRVVQPKTNGEYKVPKEVVDEYKDKDRRPKLMSMFEKLGYDPASWAELPLIISAVLGVLMHTSCNHPLRSFSSRRSSTCTSRSTRSGFRLTTSL